MTRHLFPLLFGIAIACPANAVKGYHLWYDENGQAVYSQFAPEDGAQGEIIKPPPPPAESPEVAQQRLQQQIQKSEDFFEDKALSREEKARAGSEAAQARKRCESARKNMEVLTGPPNRLYRKSDGSFERLDEEQREQQRREMEKIIAENCK